MSFPPNHCSEAAGKSAPSFTTPSVARAPKADVARGGTHFQDRPPAVQAAFCGQCFRTVSATLTSYVDVGKVGSDAMPVSQVDAGPDRDAHIVGNIDRDISGGSLQQRIVTFSASVDQFHRNSTRTGFGARRRHAVQLNAASTSLRSHMPFGRCQVNAASAGIDVDRAADISKIDAATPGGNLHFTVALPHLDAAAPGFDGRPLHARLNFHTPPTGFRHHLTLGLMDFNRAPAGVQAQISPDRARVNRSPASFRANDSADIIHVDTAPTALRVNPAGKAGGVNTAACRLHLHSLHIARNIYRELARELPRSPALPVSDDPGGVSPHIGIDLVGIELAACVLLGRSVGACMDGVIDTLLLAASHVDRPHVDFDPQVLNCGKGTRDFLAPGAAFARHACFLGHPQRYQQGQCKNKSDEMWQTFQISILSTTVLDYPSGCRQFSINFRQLSQLRAGLRPDVLVL